MEIKAIETVYKGYRFRSRLEARWAVFFDALGWNWEYEQEGFELESGRYLPDFFFPEINYYAEVKGVEATEIEIKKCLELSNKTFQSGNSQHNVQVILLQGVPDYKTYRMFTEGEEMCPVVLVGKGLKYYPLFYDTDFDRDYWGVTCIAIEKSRHARFEFGENTF